MTHTRFKEPKSAQSLKSPILKNSYSRFRLAVANAVGTLLLAVAWLGATHGYWENPDFAFIGDHMRPHLQIDTFLNDGISTLPRLSRLPSLFPDYLDALISAPLKTTYNSWLFLNAFLNGVWLSASGALLVSRISRSSYWQACISTSLAVAACSLHLEGFGFYAGLSTMPIHHGGNLTATLIMLAWALSISHHKVNKWILSTTFVGCALFSFDNLFFITTYLLPLLILTTSRLVLANSLSPETRKLRSFSLASASGCLAGYIVIQFIPTECTNALTLDIATFQESLRYHLWPRQGEGDRLLLYSLIAYSAFVVTAFKYSTQQTGEFITIKSTAAQIGLGMLAPMLMLSLFSDNRYSAGKYILPALLLTPFLASGTALVLYKKSIASASVHLASCLAVFSIVMSISLPQASGAWQDARSWKPFDKLDGINNIRQGLYLIDSSLDPLALEMYTNHRIRAVPIASDGNPWLWHYSQNDIRSSLSSATVSGLIAGDNLDAGKLSSIAERYGQIKMTESSKTGASARIITIYNLSDPSKATDYLLQLASEDSSIGCDGFRLD